MRIGTFIVVGPLPKLQFPALTPAVWSIPFATASLLPEVGARLLVGVVHLAPVSAVEP